MPWLIRLAVDLAALGRWSAARGFVTPKVADEGRALHHLLTETFGPQALQPFRLMPSRRDRANLYAWSDADPEALRELGRSCALPDAAAVLDPARIEGRMPPPFRAGQRLGFDVRLRPVVRLLADLEGLTAAGTPVRFSRGAEVDAFLARALRADPGDRGVERQQVYLDWLAARLHGAELDRTTTRLHAFRRVVALRGGRAVEGPEAVIHGTLTLHDPEAFAAGLRRGVGRHCAYGYGMLLLRPPQAPVPRC